MRVYLKKGWEEKLLPKLVEEHTIAYFDKCREIKFDTFSIQLENNGKYAIHVGFSYFREKLEKKVKPFIEEIYLSEGIKWKVPKNKEFEIKHHLINKKILNKLFGIGGVIRADFRCWSSEKLYLNLDGTLTPQEWEELKKIIKEIETELMRFGLMEL